MLCRLFLLLAFAFAAAPLHVAAAQIRISKAGVRKDVVAVVEAQLAAFRDEDPNQAYALASATMRAQMPLRTFTAIVRTNYPEIWANTRAEYGLVRDDGTRATLVAHVYSERGYAAFDYVLLKERNGWRIGSVVRHLGRKKDDV